MTRDNVHVKQLSSKLSNMKFMMRGAPLSTGSSGKPAAAVHEVVVPASAPSPSLPTKPMNVESPGGAEEPPKAAKLIVEVDTSYLPFLGGAPLGRTSFGAAKQSGDAGANESAKEPEATVTDEDMARLIGSRDSAAPVRGQKRRRDNDDNDGDRGRDPNLHAKDGGVKKAKKTPWATGKSSKRFFSKPME